MVNLDLLFAIIFYGIIIILFFKKRDKFEVQGKIIALYKTKIGLKLMDKLAKLCPRFTHFLGYIGILAGFFGMVLIFYFLFKGTFDLLFVADAPPAVAPVLPGIRIPGLPILSFWHWVIGIFFVATVHEFSHGIWARLYKIKIKSSGFLFLGPILGAFVEPDEKQLAKKTKAQQLAVFSAGPFSNMIFGVIFLLILNFATTPFYLSMHEGSGIVSNQIMEGYPAEKAGIEAPVIILALNGKPTNNLDEFVNATKDITPNQQITLTTDKGDFSILTAENPDNKSKGFIGVAEFSLKTKIKDEVLNKYGKFFPSFFSWIHLLVFWLALINIGIGLFNLLPLGPIDGGKMFFVAMQGIFKNEQKAKKIWSFVSLLCLLLIFINLAPYLWKLLMWIIKPLITLIVFLGML